MLPYKLITFDATGTLIFFKVPIIEKYLQTGLKFGIKAEPKTLRENLKDAWLSLNQQHPNFGSRTGIGWQSWWTEFVERSFAGFVKPEEKPTVTAIAQHLISFYTTKKGFAVRPGTEELLKYLQKKSVQLGVVSNNDPRLHQVLECLSLKNYFNFVLTSYEFGHSKPDEKIFKEAMRLGKCQATIEALHVGNNLELDYKGAKRAGLNAIFIGRTGLEDKIASNEHFKDFYALKRHLQSLAKDRKRV